MEDNEEITGISGVKGCAFCGGLGHRMRDCPKLDRNSVANANNRKDCFGSGGYKGEI